MWVGGGGNINALVADLDPVRDIRWERRAVPRNSGALSPLSICPM